MNCNDSKLRFDEKIGTLISRMSKGRTLIKMEGAGVLQLFQNVAQRSKRFV